MLVPKKNKKSLGIDKTGLGALKFFDTKEPGVLKCEELDLELEVLSISFFFNSWTLASGSSPPPPRVGTEIEGSLEK